MPTYLYECKVHGIVSVIKSMDDAGRDEFCMDCASALRHDAQGEISAERIWATQMRRLYTSPGLIVRSMFYNLSPDDPKYSSRLTFAREKELGMLRPPPPSAALDRSTQQALAEEDWPDRPLPEPSDHHLQQLSEFIQHNVSEPDVAEAALRSDAPIPK